MASNKNLLILPGDGIGPEVMREVRRVIDWMDKRRAVTFDISEGRVGGSAIDADGTPLTDETMADAIAADAVLLGAVGGPKWDDLPFEMKPERGDNLTDPNRGVNQLMYLSQKFEDHDPMNSASCA